MTTTSEPSAAIEALGLGKAFGAVKAVDGFDLSVPSGGVFALLGPNGAGKTTTIRIFATLIRPDVGIARVLGHDVTSEPHAVRAAERALMAGTWAAGQIGWVLLASAALTAVFGPLTMRLYRAGQGGS